MKTQVFEGLDKGDLIKLKPNRAAAYDLAEPWIAFDRLSYHPGYKVPHIVAILPDGATGVFKTSDFVSWKNRPLPKQQPVFTNCNVCGRGLVREDEFAVGMCAICANETV